jgi:fructokinase
MSAEAPLLAGVELGGTKCICLIGTAHDDIREQASIPTTGDADVTLSRIEASLRGWQNRHGPIAALGIASFGPVDLQRSSASYGFITTTPKPGWRNTNVGPRLAQALRVPLGFDTDTNGAALAEGRWGAARGLTDFAYITVGTGIGVGVIAAGRPVGGISHPELGHIRVARAPGDSWPGACIFHGDCLEGLAAGPAIAQRTGRRGEELAADDPAWALVTHALAQLLLTLVLATAPQRILLGGGVMQSQQHLFPRLRRELQRNLNHYIHARELEAGIDDYVRPPELGQLVGPLGALALAQDALGT